MKPESYQRFLALRREVMAQIKLALDEDPFCKSYEGEFEIILNYPNYFEDAEGVMGVDVYGIRLSCYVLGSGRLYEWWGTTFEEALSKAETEIHSWRDDNDG